MSLQAKLRVQHLFVTCREARNCVASCRMLKRIMRWKLFTSCRLHVTRDNIHKTIFSASCKAMLGLAGTGESTVLQVVKKDRCSSLKIRALSHKYQEENVPRKKKRRKDYIELNGAPKKQWLMSITHPCEGGTVSLLLPPTCIPVWKQEGKSNLNLHSLKLMIPLGFDIHEVIVLR